MRLGDALFINCAKGFFIGYEVFVIFRYATSQNLFALKIKVNDYKRFRTLIRTGQAKASLRRIRNIPHCFELFRCWQQILEAQLVVIGFMDQTGWS